MGLVRFALRFPYTFFGLAALILFLGLSAISVMPIDIFPEINIPVVNVIWQYTGLSTPEMEQRVSTYSQYAISTSVSGIKNMEAQTLNGISVQKIFFQPDVNIDLAIAQIVSATNYIRVLLPTGIYAPIVVSYNASSIPVLQLSLASHNLNEQKLYDYGYYNLRQQLAPVPGVTFPTPDGGKYRQIMVDIDPTKLQAKGLTPTDVINAVNAENLTLPSGLAKIGEKQYTVLTNAMPTTIEALNNIPVKFANGATVFLKDIGQVRDASAVQQNIVRQNGERSVLLSVIKNGNASTLAVVKGVRKALEVARAAAPPGLSINELFDQAKLVSDSVASVVREGAIAAGLTALMILLFLGSWRSTLIVMISIPLSILTSIIMLHFLGETINTMTLGGMALAVGILVDDSTVTIENTHRLRTEEGMSLPAATLHGSAGIAVPTLVSTLAISCVFTSVVFLEGPAKFLFTPLGLAVVFAMLASYGLSRTLTPIMIGLLLKGEHHRETGGSRGWFARLHRAFERGFERLREGYVGVLTVLLTRRVIVPATALLIIALGGVMLTLTGRDFFPAIDGGQIKLHVRAPAGTRIEVTEAVFQAVEDKIREVIPERERDLIVDDIGVPQRVYNLAFTDGSTIGPNDGVILVALKPGHAPTARYVRKLREVLPAEFPEVTFYFQAADMVTQILNFGLPAQIDVRTVGRDRATNLRVTKELRRRIAEIPGIVDAHLQQEIDGPAFMAAIDRARALQFGLNAQSIANDVNISLSSSAQVTPNFWTDPTSGIPYYITVQTPQRQVSSLGEVGNTPIATKISSTGSPIPGLLSNVARFHRHSVPTNLNQTNIQPAYDVYASVQGRDLGRVSQDISKIVAELQRELKPGNSIEVRGQIQSMNDSFRNLAFGLLFAAVLVYLLMLVNYQNLGDPFVVILALPATLCGIFTMLFITGTSLSVPSLMGAIMAVGVASANSILLVTFAREQQLAGRTAFQAAIDAGHTRIRPVLMTAAAMIVGMIPMAIGGAGEEQNAALARAVIGGLVFATPTTLLIVPYLFAMLRKRNDSRSFPMHDIDIPDREQQAAVDYQAAKTPLDHPDARARWGGRVFGLGAFLLLAGGLAFGASRSYSQQRQVMATAEQIRDFVPSVRVAAVQASDATVRVSLPATASAFSVANMYARASGYIDKRYVDIGDRVKEGQLLVAIVAPELDHQISQAEATLIQLRAAVEQAQANRKLAQVTWDRDKGLVEKGWVTAQQGDVDLFTLQAREAGLGVALANVTAQEAQLQVLRQQKAYQRVVAPFDGVVTQRNVEVGDLVHADTTNGTFLFTVMQSDVIRAQVYVPQDSAFGLSPGVDAVVRVPEIPRRTFPGKVTRIAQALEAGTRTLLTEIDIPNPDGALAPGSYCIIELKIPRKTPSFLVSADAIIFNQNGPQVAVVEGGTAHMRNVSVTRDLGTQVEVDEGVEHGDQVIINPPVTLVDGSKVRPRAKPAVPRT